MLSSPGTPLKIEAHARGPFATNTYLVLDEEGGRGYVVDPTMEAEDVLESVVSRDIEVLAVVNTHGHLDHVFLNAAFCRRLDAPLWVHEADLPLLREVGTQASLFGLEAPEAVEPARFLVEGDLLSLGEESLRVLHTPGHSPGGICLVGPGAVIAGDALFAGSVGRTDLWGGDFPTLRLSIREKIFVLPDDTRVLPGHGPETTVGRERRANPFVGEEAAP